jgi:hypothetical protein
LTSRKASVSGSSEDRDRDERMTEREAGTQGLKSWWKSFRDKPEQGKAKGKLAAKLADVQKTQSCSAQRLASHSSLRLYKSPLLEPTEVSMSGGGS